MSRRQRPTGSAAVWTSPDGTRRFYARRARQWQLPLLTWFFGGIALIGPASEFGLYDRWQIGLPFVVLVLVAGACITHGAIRSGIVIEPGHLTNRRMLSTHRVAAGDIARFEPPPSYGTVRRSGLRIVLNDGRVLSATAFNKGRIDSDLVGVAECAELNEWLDAQSHGRLTPPLY